MLTGIEWVDFLIVAAAVTTAIYTLWRRVLKPFIKTVNVIAESAPILITIAREFNADHGETLRDVVDGLRGDISGIRNDISEIRPQLNRQDASLEHIHEKVCE